MTTCYMCNAEATSKEHVPPRSFFPAEKDLPAGVALRKQLITVPSCDQHNTQKSTDDEYLHYAVLMCIANNPTGQKYFAAKGVRAIDKNRPVFEELVRQHRPVIAQDTTTGVRSRTLALKLDMARIKAALEKMGRGLYFHHFQTKWLARVDVYPHFVIDLEGPNPRQFNDTNQSLLHFVETRLATEPTQGANTEVFSYRFSVVDATDLHVIALLSFYEASHVTLLLKPEICSKQ